MTMNKKTTPATAAPKKKTTATTKSATTTKAAAKTAKAAPAAKKPGRPATRKRTLSLIKNDPWLEPFAAAIEGRHEDVVRRRAELLSGGAKTLNDFANAHQYFGLHRTSDGWVFREWAPHATSIRLVGDFSGWEPMSRYDLTRLQICVTELL